MTVSMIQIMNAALISQGFDDIVSENDGSDEWRIMSRNWATIVEAELEVGLYSFTRQEAEILERQAGRFGYTDAYLTPPGALHIRRVWVMRGGMKDDTLDWVQDNERVFINWPDGIFVEYVTVPDTAFWGANFTRGVQMKLEAVLLRVAEEPQRAAGMEQEAEKHFQLARTVSSKSRSAREPFRPSRFARARFGRA